MSFIHHFTQDREFTADFVGPGGTFPITFSGTPRQGTYAVYRLNDGDGKFMSVGEGNINEGTAYIGDFAGHTYRIQINVMNQTPVDVFVEVFND